MKTIGSGLALVMVACGIACGGTGDPNLPDGGGSDAPNGNDGTTTNDTGTNDTGTTNDTGANDTGTTDAGNDVATFNPANVPNLVLWLEADVSTSITTMTPDGGSPKVTKWADQTSHHNDAVGLQNFLARNPSVKGNAINSLAAMHFAQGSGNQISGQMLTVNDNTDTSLQWGTGDFFVAIVADYDNNPSNGQVLGVGNFFSKAVSPAQGTYTGVLFFGNIPSSSQNPNVGLLFGTASTANDFVVSSNQYNNGNPHLFALRRRGAKIDLFVDNGSVASATSNGVDVSNAKTPIRIGADGDANLFKLDGDIGEMMAVKGVLSQSDEAGLVAYLKTKWATP